MKIKLIEFLSYDPAKLVDIHEVDLLLAKAKKEGVEKGNILYMELNEIYKKAEKAKKNLEQFSTCSWKTYVEAKFVF